MGQQSVLENFEFVDSGELTYTHTSGNTNGNESEAHGLNYQPLVIGVFKDETVSPTRLYSLPYISIENSGGDAGKTNEVFTLFTDTANVTILVNLSTIATSRYNTSFSITFQYYMFKEKATS